MKTNLPNIYAYAIEQTEKDLLQVTIPKKRKKIQKRLKWLRWANRILNLKWKVTMDTIDVDIDGSEILVTQLKAVLKAKELFDLGAKILKETCDALENNGFTRTEAIQIIAGQGSIVKGS